MSDDAVPDALREHAEPLAGTGAGEGTDLPAALTDRFGSADVVGLGEATHGTRECFTLKARFVRALVERHGVRTVAFEADAAAAGAVDDHVAAGEGRLDDAVAGLHKWLWRTAAVRDLFAWLRSFNEGRPPEDRVRVRGVDLSDPAAPADALADRLGEVAPDLAGSDDLATLRNWSVPDDGAAREREVERAVAAARALDDRLAGRRASLVEAGSAGAFERARYLCRVAEQAAEWARVRHEHEGPHAAGMAARDRYVAENAARCLERDRGDGVALWAHNAHVKRGTFDDGQVWTDAPAAGEHLDREFGERYCPLGFDVVRGSFRAAPADPDRTDPRVYGVGDPRPDSATAAFDRLDPPFALDLRAAAGDPALADWLAADRRVRWVGTVYDADAGPGEHYMHTDLPGSFDLLTVVGESTPTRPLSE